MTDVLLTSAACVFGARIVKCAGSIELRRTFQGPSWEEAVEQILSEATEKARALGCNAILYVQIIVDPYRTDGAQLHFCGTPGQLEPIFDEDLAQIFAVNPSLEERIA